jgi:hypothetical protein
VSEVQVVITRKHKRLHKGWHVLAFMLTGGVSAPVTAARVAANAAYNAETARLAGSSGTGNRTKRKLTDEERAYFAAHVPKSARSRI